MRGLLMLAAVLTVASCGPDSALPLAPASPQLAVTTGAGPSVRGQFTFGRSVPNTQYRFAVTGAGGSITFINRFAGGETTQSVSPVLTLCSFDVSDVRLARMVTFVYDAVNVLEVWVGRRRGERGMEYWYYVKNRQIPPGVDPCTPDHVPWSQVRWDLPAVGALHIGL